MTYQEKLKDGRWQIRRLEIIKRDNGKCIVCGSTEKIEVHHIKYLGNPWDAPEEYLITLCNNCHEKQHDFGEIKVKKLIDYLAITKRYSWIDIEKLYQMLIYVEKEDIDKLKFCLAHPTSKNMLLEIGQKALDVYP